MLKTILAWLSRAVNIRRVYNIMSQYEMSTSGKLLSTHNMHIYKITFITLRPSRFCQGFMHNEYLVFFLFHQFPLSFFSLVISVLASNLCYYFIFFDSPFQDIYSISPIPVPFKIVLLLLVCMLGKLATCLPFFHFQCELFHTNLCKSLLYHHRIHIYFPKTRSKTITTKSNTVHSQGRQRSIKLTDSLATCVTILFSGNNIER